MEKEEIQHALNDAESALEVEESKVFRLQTEVSQIRQEVRAPAAACFPLSPFAYLSLPLYASTLAD